MTAVVLSPDERDIRKIVFHHNETTRGRSNATGTVTLTANATTTTVTAANCASGSVVLLGAMTANAALAIALSPGVYASSIGQGTFTLTHDNNAQTDRTFGYVCLG